MQNQKFYHNYDISIQLKIPVDFEKIIEISDPIYTFNEIMEQIDLQKHFVGKGNKMGRPIPFKETKSIGGGINQMVNEIILAHFLMGAYLECNKTEEFYTICEKDLNLRSFSLF